MGVCPVAEGTVALATARICPAHSVLPCRVAYYADEATSFAPDYGALPGHPERGVEPRHVGFEDQGVASFHVVAFSRRNDLHPVAGPFATSVPSMATRRCTSGMKRYAAAPPTPDKRAREGPFCVLAGRARASLSRVVPHLIEDSRPPIAVSRHVPCRAGPPRRNDPHISTLPKRPGCTDGPRGPPPGATCDWSSSTVLAAFYHQRQ